MCAAYSALCPSLTPVAQALVVIGTKLGSDLPPCPEVGGEAALTSIYCADISYMAGHPGRSVCTQGWVPRVSVAFGRGCPPPISESCRFERAPPFSDGPCNDWI
jgi:hypothetical protein